MRDIESLITAVQHLKLEPGAVLVLHVDQILSESRMRAIREFVEPFFPGNKCLVLCRGLSLEVVTQEL